MGKIVIDAKNLILGRMGTIVAKMAMLGNTVDIVNCEDCVIRGDRNEIIARYKVKDVRGIPSKGPFINKKPNLFVKRSIRGMLNYKQGRGRDAFKSIKCYLGVPDDFKDKELKTLDEVNVLKQKSSKIGSMKVGDLCNIMGWKTK